MATKSTSTTARKEGGKPATAEDPEDLSELFSHIKTLGEALGVMGVHSDEMMPPTIASAGEIGELICTLAMRGQKALESRKKAVQS